MELKLKLSPLISGNTKKYGILYKHCFLKIFKLLRFVLKLQDKERISFPFKAFFKNAICLLS